MFEMMKVANKIKETRMRRNMTQMQLADEMGVSYQAVSNWERGNSMPDISKLGELARILEISLDDLLGESDETVIVKKIIEGDGESGVTIKDVKEVAPIVPPHKMSEILEEMEEQADAISLDDVIGIAPFVESSYLDKLALKVAEVGHISELMAIAPFLSEETLGTLATKLTESGELHDIIGLAPFLSDEALEGLVDKAKVEDLSSLAGLAPFLNKKTLDSLMNEAIEKDRVGECAGLLPFLDKETVRKLADSYVAKGELKMLTLLAPFL